MKKRGLKGLCMGLVLLFSLSIFAGCSRDEIGFYNMMKSVSMMKGSVEVDSTLTMTITSDNAEWKNVVGEEVAEMLSDIKFTCTGKANLDNMSEEVTVSMVIKDTETRIGTMKLVDGMLYLNTQDMLKALKTVLPVDKYNAVSNAVQGKAWISMDMMETFDPSGVLPENYLEESRNILQVYYDFMSAFFLNGYKNYSSGMVDRVGNGYRLTITGENLGDFIKTAGIYSIANVKEIGAALKTFIADANAEGKEMIFGTVDITAKEIDEFVTEVMESKGELNQSVTEFADLFANEFLPLIKGSKFEMVIEGTEDGGYKDSVVFHFVVNDEKGDNIIKILVEGKDVTKKIETVTISAPQDVISWEDVKKGLPSTKSIRIFNDKSYVMHEQIELDITSIPMDYKFDFMSNLLEKDGYRYYPLRQVGEALGEEVGWSEAGQTAYVVNPEGARVSFTGIEKDGVMYIKVRDFEKIGYTVEWDEASQSMYIYR